MKLLRRAEWSSASSRLPCDATGLVQALVRGIHTGEGEGVRAALLAADSDRPGTEGLVERTVNKPPEEAVVPLIEEIVKCMKVTKKHC